MRSGGPSQGGSDALKLPAPGGQPAGLLGDPGRIAAHQHSRVVARRRVQDARDRARLAHHSTLHDHHLVAERGQQPEVVGHEDHRAARLGLELAQQCHDLRLQRRIERGGGLVGDQQVRAHHHRHRDGHALALTARELVRIGAQPLFGLRHSDPLEHLGGAAALALPTAGVAVLDVGHLPPDREGGNEGSERVLRDEGYPGAPQRPHLPGREREEVAPVEEDAPARDPRRGRQQAQDRGAERGFPLPLSPTTPTTRPRPTRSETSCSAGTPA